MTKHTNPANPVLQQIAALRQVVTAATADLAALEKRVTAPPAAPGKTARGTGDVTADARTAALAGAPLGQRVEETLRGGLLTIEEIRHAVRAPAGPVSTELRRLRAKRRLWNAGTEDAPRHFLRPDVNASAYAELAAAIAHLVTDRPMTLREVVGALTDAAPDTDEWEHARNRASGVLKNLQRDGWKLHMLGTATRRRWFFTAPATKGHAARRGA